ncbi:MAG: transposase [Anaerolineae bacterium]
MSNFTTLPAFLPIDIGKNVHWFAVLVGYDLTPLITPRKVRSNQEGCAEIVAVLDQLLFRGLYHPVVPGLESTGIYHEGLARALHERYADRRAPDAQPRLDFRFLNPLVVKRQRDVLSGARPRKTDRIDLDAIAICLRDGQGYPAALPTADELPFVLWARDYRATQRQRRRLEVRLLSQIDQLWPGLLVNVQRFRKMHPELEAPVPLVHSKPLERRSIQAILRHCPNPHDFLALGQQGIQAFFRQHVGRCGPKTAGRAWAIVSEALLVPDDIAQLLAAQLQADALAFFDLLAHIEALEQQADILVPHSPAAVLVTVPGISARLAARYLAYLRHHRRFLDAAEIWAFAGFDLVTEESGDFRRLGKITKKGHPGLRDTLYLIGYHVAKHVPQIARTKAKARQRGLGAVGATLHAAHRVNRILFRMLVDQAPFDPDRLR